MFKLQAHRCAIAVLLALSGVVPFAGALPADVAKAVKPALQNERLGLYPADGLRLTDGKCSDCPTIPQALWYFRDEVIAVPKAGMPVAGFSKVERGKQDVHLWSSSPEAKTMAYPGLVWIGAPQIVEEAAILADGRSLRLATGDLLPWQLTPKIATNLSYFDASSLGFFEQGPVRVRGTLGTINGEPKFTARTIWPKDFALPQTPMTSQPLTEKDDLVAYVRAQNGGAKSPYSTRLLWERTPGAAQQSQGQPVLGLMLNGGQGDDDEAYGGHFAVTTGTVGPRGEMADWLVNNFYGLDAYGEKGILAGSVPMDNYLADLNSGQNYYRPSYMLVAVLNNPRTAAAYQGGAQRIYNHYYRHDFAYDGALQNCSGISMDVFSALGWNVPKRGATHPLMALAAYPYKAITEVSLKQGRKAFEYLSEEQTRLYPAVAFDAAGQDLLQILSGKAGRALTPYEQQLQTDVDALILVRLPQFPSSRAFGSAPVFSYDEYMARAPANHADWKIIPVAPKPFPPALRDGLAVDPPERSLLPWQVGVSGAVLLLLLVAMGWLIRRAIGSRRNAVPPAPVAPVMPAQTRED